MEKNLEEEEVEEAEKRRSGGAEERARKRDVWRSGASEAKEQAG